MAGMSDQELHAIESRAVKAIMDLSRILLNDGYDKNQASTFFSRLHFYAGEHAFDLRQSWGAS